VQSLLTKTSEDLSKADKNLRVLQTEREKMRQRIIKLKNRRNFNLNEKICRACGQEYLEVNNFNWSCHTHTVIFNLLIFILV